MEAQIKIGTVLWIGNSRGLIASAHPGVPRNYTQQFTHFRSGQVIVLQSRVCEDSQGKWTQYEIFDGEKRMYIEDTRLEDAIEQEEVEILRHGQ